MIEDIKQIIADNSEEKHFVEYGKGVFATEDAVDEIAEEIVKLFAIHNVSQHRELLNALADNFNESTHTYVGQPMIEETLKAFNCG